MHKAAKRKDRSTESPTMTEINLQDHQWFTFNVRLQPLMTYSFDWLVSLAVVITKCLQPVALYSHRRGGQTLSQLALGFIPSPFLHTSHLSGADEDVCTCYTQRHYQFQSLAWLWRLVTEPWRSFWSVGDSLKFGMRVFFFFLFSPLSMCYTKFLLPFERLAWQWEEGTVTGINITWWRFVSSKSVWGVFQTDVSGIRRSLHAQLSALFAVISIFFFGSSRGNKTMWILYRIIFTHVHIL